MASYASRIAFSTYNLGLYPALDGHKIVSIAEARRKSERSQARFQWAPVTAGLLGALSSRIDQVEFKSLNSHLLSILPYCTYSVGHNVDSLDEDVYTRRSIAECHPSYPTWRCVACEKVYIE
jgi:hypothetical protein